MQRILHIVGKMDRAGAETMIMNLYRNIDRNEFQFDFITFTTNKGDYDDEILTLGGKIFPIIASNNITRTFKLKSFLAKNKNYKIIHSHMLLNAGFHVLAAKMAGVKHRIVHSHSTSNGTNNFIAKCYEQFSKLLITNFSTYLIACGIQASNYLFGKNSNVWLLPNAVSLESLVKIGKHNKKYIESNFGCNGLKIIQVGRLAPVKNYNFTIKLAEFLKSNNVKFSLFIIGQGSEYEYIEKRILDMGLEENVILLGVRSDVAEIMSSADLMLMPSLHEGFPLVLAESQAIGLNTIVSTGVSSEVDLGVNLIQFIDLNEDLKIWMNKIVSSNSTQVDEHIRLKTLQNKGFDVNVNVKKIESFYRKCI